jgi:hypothetical protein
MHAHWHSQWAPLCDRSRREPCHTWSEGGARDVRATGACPRVSAPHAPRRDRVGEEEPLQSQPPQGRRENAEARRPYQRPARKQQAKAKPKQRQSDKKSRSRARGSKEAEHRRHPATLRSAAKGGSQQGWVGRALGRSGLGVPLGRVRGVRARWRSLAGLWVLPTPPPPTQ